MSVLTSRFRCMIIVNLLLFFTQSAEAQSNGRIPFTLTNNIYNGRNGNTRDGVPLKFEINNASRILVDLRSLSGYGSSDGWFSGGSISEAIDVELQLYLRNPQDTFRSETFSLYNVKGSSRHAIGPSSAVSSLQYLVDLSGYLPSHRSLLTTAVLSLPTFFSRSNGNPSQITLQGGAVARGDIFLNPVVPKHIIVLAHGWNNDEAPSVPSYLSTLETTVKDRLGDRISSGEVVLVTPTLSGFYTPFSTEGYATAYGQASNAGDVIFSRVNAEIDRANRINKLLNPGSPDYEPTIHLIGHSLGTVANAFAVDSLHKAGINVDMVTLLDTPLHASYSVAAQIGVSGLTKQKLVSFDDAFLFWSKMPTGSVDYVENFYADPNLRDVSVRSPAFGQPIAGTVPCENGGCYGHQVANSNHESVWKQFYSGVVRGTDGLPWRTPALYGQSEPYQLRWTPTDDLAATVEAFNDSLTDSDAQLWIDSRTTVFGRDLINDWQRSIGTVIFQENQIEAVSNSPSAFSAFFDPRDVLGMQFEFEVHGTTSGVITLAFDGTEIFRRELSASSLQDVVYVSTFQYTQSGRLEWTFDSDVSGSRAKFSRFTFVRAIAVPEPPIGHLTLCGFLIVCSQLRRMPGKLGLGRASM